jgi:RES domain-containing protein
VIRCWRLVKEKHASTAFSGMGARLAGGRWNLAGDAAVYVSGTLSLAALELFVHLGPRSTAAFGLVGIPVEIPAQLISEPPSLPKNWRAQPPPSTTRILGSEWLRSGESCVLGVPSAIVPVENNFVLNPAHPDFSAIEIGEAQTFSFDPRMWKDS